MRRMFKRHFALGLIIVAVLVIAALVSACSGSPAQTTPASTSSPTPPQPAEPSSTSTAVPTTSTTPLPTGQPPSIVSSSLAGATAGTAYSQTLAATGGVAPYIWTISNQRLPLGLALDSPTGAISGTPTGAANYFFSVKVTDSLGLSSSQAFVIKVAANPQATPPISPTPASVPASDSTSTPTPTPTTLMVATQNLPDGTIGTYYSQTFDASNGVSPLTWSYFGDLPPGFSLDANTGMLFGTPGVANTYTLIIQVTDLTGQIAIESITLKIASQ